MVGPLSLDLKTISEVITSISPGAYILSKNGRGADYVGRSDTDLANRVKNWVNHINRYAHFWFEYAASPKVAFDLECAWAHAYMYIDNQNHPARPNGSDWQCRSCNVFK